MKKLLTLLLVAAIAVTAVACTASPSAPSAPESSSASESVSSSESSAAESLPEDSAPEFAVPAENQKLGDILSAARPAEFNEYHPAILSTEDPNAAMIFDVMSLKAEDLSSFAISVSMMNTQAYGIAILKPAEGKNEAVLAAANAWVAAQQKSFEQYLVDQYEIAKAATVDQLDDGTVVLVMSEGGEAIQKNILDALKK